MSEQCQDCAHQERCKWLLGTSYRPDGPCDWTPSKWSQAYGLPPSLDRCLRCGVGVLDSRLGGMCGDCQ